MTKEPTIFDEMIDNAERKIRRLQQSIDELQRANAALRRDIDSTSKSLAESPWNEKAEARDDIRYYEGEISVNNKLIEEYLIQIQDLQGEIQESMKLKNPGKKR